MKRQIAIQDSIEISEIEKNKKINSITVAIARVGAFKDLTFGLLDVFDKLIDKNNSTDQSYLNAEALKLLYKFHHQALIMNDTEFLQHVWDLYVNNGIGINKTDDKHTDSQHESSAFDIIKNVLQDVGIEADRIEENMHQHKDNNEYVLTRPNDLTTFYEGILNSMGLPAFIGYIIAGCVLGPAGCNVIQELIQTETLSQLGVVFIVFMLGLEFSFDKIRSIWKFALCSATMIFLSTLSFFVLAGAIINVSVKEAVVVGACVSLSSTAVVERLRCIELEPLYGLLVMQDVLFGVLLAAMPVLSRSVSLCLLMSQVSYILGIGAEIGCFVAGMLVHNRRTFFEFSINLVEPVKDIFSCLFFASIGLHIYPSFLINEGPLLFALTIGVVGFKFIISNIAFMTFGYNFRHANVMSIGLSQISEFAFVLGSRAKSFGIISREVYYLLLAITSLTLIVTPILWKILCRNKLDGTKETEYTIPFTNDTEKVE
ncbi:3690_t:CDS:2 [Diversispora eburnea]|uniref:3690_t:CDS:1 n=1 Tax=Diversispora eburnea TaxID=1213867 RepID=A0A9N8W713_9GLOM|nr:3690_t:CDS:2 [Diversispora eburnea]